MICTIRVSTNTFMLGFSPLQRTKAQNSEEPIKNTFSTVLSHTISLISF